MVDLAREAFVSKQFRLSAEIYERTIKTDGPKLDTLLGLADSQARSGKFHQALSTYIRCLRLGRLTPANMRQFATSLIDFMSRNGAELGLSCLLSNPSSFDAFTCGSCSGLLIEPVTIPCGHSFCHNCVKKNHSKICVTCHNVHYYLNLQDLRVNVILWNIVKKLFQTEIEAARLRLQGNELFCKNSFDMAIKIYTQAAEKAPLDHLIISNRSHAYAALKKFDKALEDAEHIIELKPDWGKGYYRKGVALSGLSRHDEACKAYMRCLALDDTAEIAREALAKELHTMVNLCSAADGKFSDTEFPGVSPLQLFSQLFPKVRDVQKSAPSSRVSSPMMPRAKSMSQGDLSPRRPDDTCREHEPGAAAGAQLVEDEVELSRYKLAFDPQKLDTNDVECSLCFRLLYLPVATPCGHVFCRHCLDRCLDHRTHCPLCKSSLEDHLAERRQATVDSIEKLILVCMPDRIHQRKVIHEEEMAAVTFAVKDGQLDIPIFVCTLGFPYMPCPLHIFEPRYRLMVRRAMETGVRQFGMCAATGTQEGEFADYGVIMEIRDVQYFADGRSLVDTLGGQRIRVVSRGLRDGYNTAVVEPVRDLTIPEREFQSLSVKCSEVYAYCKQWYDNLSTTQQRQINEQCGEFPREDRLLAGSENGPKWLWWMVAVVPLNPRAQLSFLQMVQLRDRLVGVENVVKYMTRRAGK